MLKTKLLTLLFIILGINGYTQCSFSVTPNTTQYTVCGEPVDIVMQGYSQGPVLSEDFNNNSLGAGWSTSQTVQYTNPCGPTLDGTPAAWMGSAASQPRTLTTVPFDLNCGAQICFDLDFAGDENSTDCEDPDQFNEGVHFQYSTDGGVTWTDIFYFEAISGQANAYYQWANYCFDIPAAAYSTATQLRWHQNTTSGNNFDHWGIDNVTVQPYSCGGNGYEYVVDGTISDNDTTMYPTSTTTYDLMYTNFTDDTCSTQLTVDVTPYNVFATATSTNLTCGDCTSMIVDNLNNPTPLPAYDFSWTPGTGLNDPTLKTPQACPTATTTYTGTVTDPVSGCTGNASVTINVQPLSPGFSYPAYDVCSDVGNQSPTISGDPGGVFSATPAGLNINTTTGEVDPAASTPGTYDITYEHTTAGCQSDSTITYTVNSLPPVDAGLDTSICSGETITLTATGAVTYNWDNGVVNGQSFVPTSTQTYTVIGIDGNNCQSSDQVDVAIIPADDPAFDYLSGLEYCPEDNDPLANISGTGGGTFSYMTLNGGPNLMLNNSNGGFDLSASDPGNYGIEYVTPGSCPDSSTLEIIIHPSPDANFSANKFTGCEPDTILFTADQQSGLQSTNWNFGDGQTSTDLYSTENVYMGGVFNVTHTVVSTEGCESSETYPSYIDITYFPEARFIPSPPTTNIEATDIDFNNYSEYSSTYIWDFDHDGATSNDPNPSYIYPEVPAEYDVQLMAISDDGMCVDSVTQTVVINDIIIYYIPNVFTPNADAHNNRFVPKFTSGIDIYDFHMMIFNRWGEVIFETYDPNSGWDGNYGDAGIVEDGVYIWQIEFKELASDKRYEQRGHVTVIK